MSEKRETTGISEIDALIEEFKTAPLDYGDTVAIYRDPGQAHGACQEVTEKFVDFADARGFKVYSTDTDLDELGYTIQAKAVGGEVGFDDNDVMQYGFYPEHTVASIYVEGQCFPYCIDWTAAQYGYEEFPKVTT